MVKREVTYAFIDSQNLNLGIRSLGWQLDFKKFYIYMKDRSKISEIFLFIGYMESNHKLYKYLELIGYNLIFKSVVLNKDGKIKGNVDAELVLHAAKIQYPFYTQAIIVSGDGDFVCLYEELTKEEKLARIFIPSRKSESRLLSKYRNVKLYIEDLKGKVENNRGFGAQHEN